MCVHFLLCTLYGQGSLSSPQGTLFCRDGGKTQLPSVSHRLACEKCLWYLLGCLRCMQESTRSLRIPHLPPSPSLSALPKHLYRPSESQWLQGLSPLIGAGKVGSARYLLLDEGPDDPGHLIPVHFHHGVGNLDSLVSICGEDGIRGGKTVTLPVPQVCPLDSPSLLHPGSNAGQARFESHL